MYGRKNGWMDGEIPMFGTTASYLYNMDSFTINTYATYLQNCGKHNEKKKKRRKKHH